MVLYNQDQMNTFHKLKLNESGYAAIIISMIIMSIIGLISIGFTSNALSDQKNTLKDVLTAQAYYSAESGVNDVYDIITAYERLGVPLSSIPTQTNNCMVDNLGNYSYISNTSNQLSSVNKYDKYSCLLVNPSPFSLEYKPINANTGQTILLSSANTISTVGLSWQKHITTSSSPIVFNGCPSLKKLVSQSNYINCSAPILQVDLVPTSDITNNPSYIIKNTLSFFIQPQNISSTTAIPANPTPSNASIVQGNCSSSGASRFNSEFSCDIKFNVPSGLRSNKYYMHITPFYQEADLSVQAYSAPSSAPVSLTGSQALIDVTGSSVGTSNRIEERICISNVCQNNSPIGAILSLNNICKYFTTRPGSFNTISGGCSTN